MNNMENLLHKGIKMYWRRYLVLGYRPMSPYAVICDGTLKIPERVYRYFTERELDEIKLEHKSHYDRIRRKIDELD